ncbi:MAG: molybdopterin-dependent oxidoreductase [Verrucomicrobiae bacterium]|nr:molybdopterin-dependent oxidoreductase [Verrucomicrobiae bacterium]
MAHTLTTCTFCGVGCGIYLESQGNRITGVYPSMSHPSNQGRICVRGWNVHEVASSPDRLMHPLLRKNGKFEPVSWEEAYAFIARRLQEIKARHGPDAVGFYNSPRCSNEESYLLQKLARAVMGTNNLEHGTGVYCNNSVDTLCEMLGVPASTNPISDLLESGVIVVDGVDLGMQLPTIGGWVMRAKLRGATVIVIDARRQRVAETADLHLQLRPGYRVALYGAMAKVIVDRGLMNLPFIKAHCADYEKFLQEIQAYDLVSIAESCGVPAADIEQAAIAYATAPSAAILYSTGVAARGKGSIRALVNLALLTGNLGRPGGGLYPLNEHNNLQGVCDLGMLPDRLPGYGRVEDPQAREPLEKLWGVRLPARPGVGAQEALENHTQGLKGIWLLRYDPVNTAVFCEAGQALRQMELVVVQHLFMTSTAEYAHVVLPTVAFGEEQVTFTSTDRRIQLARQVIQPPAGPRPAWLQLTQMANALGAGWHYADSAAVMEEIAQAVPFYSGATHENLGREYGRAWPCTKDRPLGTPRLFEKLSPEPQFRFAPVPRPAGTFGPTAEFPMAVIFGSSLYYWHQNVLVKHSETLKRELRVLLLDYPEGFVEVNDEDARTLGIRDGAPIRLVAAHGTSTTTARVTPEVRSGTIYVPFFVKEVMRQITGEGAFEAVSRTKPLFVRLEKV